MRVCVGDLESNGFLNVADRIWCGVFKDIKTNEIWQFRPNQMDEMVEFLDTVDVLIMHNGIGFDWPLLEKILGYEYEGIRIDTYRMSQMQNPKRKIPFGYQGKGGTHSIECWGYRLHRWKPYHEDWTMFSEDMLFRCTEDVEILHLVYNELVQEAFDLGGAWKSAYQMTFKAFHIIHRQEEFGWLVDQDWANKALSMLNHWMDRICKVLSDRLPFTYEVAESGWTRNNPKFVKKPFLNSGKPNAHMVKFWGEDAHLIGGPHTRLNWRRVSLDKDVEVKKFLLDTGWEPAEWNTKKEGGQEIRTSPKLSKDDKFEGIQGSMGRLIAKRIQCKARRSIISGWLDKLRPDGRLPSVITGVAVTGRAKHSIIVNTPNADAFFGKWMRKCFTVPEGKKLIGCDAAGCQDRMLAQRAKNDEFTEMLLNGDKSKGTDAHSLTMKAVNKVLGKHGLPLISRQKAKNFNYGWKFGASDNKLAKMAGGSLEVGAEIRVALAEMFPAQAGVIQRLSDEWRATAQKVEKWGKTQYTNGYFIGLDGRPIYVESEHALLVYCLQSDEALMMTWAYNLLYERLNTAGYIWGVHYAIVNWNHDEYSIEVDEDIAEEVAKIAEQCINDAGIHFGLTYCPQVGEAAIGNNWYEVH